MVVLSRFVPFSWLSLMMFYVSTTCVSPGHRKKPQKPLLPKREGGWSRRRFECVKPRRIAETSTVNFDSTWVKCLLCICHDDNFIGQSPATPCGRLEMVVTIQIHIHMIVNPSFTPASSHQRPPQLHFATTIMYVKRGNQSSFVRETQSSRTLNASIAVVGTL